MKKLKGLIEKLNEKPSSCFMLVLNKYVYLEKINKTWNPTRFFRVKPETRPLYNFNFYLNPNPTRSVGSLKNPIPKPDERVFPNHGWYLFQFSLKCSKNLTLCSIIQILLKSIFASSNAFLKNQKVCFSTFCDDCSNLNFKCTGTPIINILDGNYERMCEISSVVINYPNDVQVRVPTILYNLLEIMEMRGLKTPEIYRLNGDENQIKNFFNKYNLAYNRPNVFSM